MAIAINSSLNLAEHDTINSEIQLLYVKQTCEIMPLLTDSKLIKF